MSKINFNSQNGKTNKKGLYFYVAIGICVVAVGVAAFTTYDSIKRFTGQDEDIIASKTQQRYKVQENKGANDVQAEGKESSLSNTSSAQYNQQNMSHTNSTADNYVTANAGSAGVIVYPTSKNIVKEFSGDNPVFSKTLNDWRVHNGLDLAAEQGSKVKAITNGKVKEIYNDQLFGTTIVIEHEGGFTAYYSGLGETTLVNVDDNVESGQEIASINDVPCEAADGYHLHLAIKKDEKFINPTEILG